MCESGFPVSADQARLVLGVPVFAQPHDPGVSPGEAVASPGILHCGTTFTGDGTDITELQNCCLPAQTQNYFADVFVYFVYLCFHRWT